ncbi:DUF429 domain-containing protein [Streptomyces macrosporus]|uniref:DUF429 domain-containing protein n=1 Tax=Streptomyces macrosporus TaxID=44032 RepID=A0ABN3JMP6_9ACTN
MRTVGVDLAAGERTTAAAVVVWNGPTAVVEPPRRRCADDELIDLLAGLRPGERAGVDCPFGWPIPFVRALTAHAAHETWPGRGRPGADHRATLRHRRTDVWVRRQLGPGARPPLSVSFDKLGATAARWAHLADALAARGQEVDRRGTGRIVEVYPAAARLRWGLAGERSMAALRRAAPWLGCEPDVEREYDRDEHAFDALIAALVARAVARGLTRWPTGEDREAARIEGWIHLPEPDSLSRLPREDRGRPS